GGRVGRGTPPVAPKHKGDTPPVTLRKRCNAPPIALCKRLDALALESWVSRDAAPRVPCLELLPPTRSIS
ncbi:hypothetical protein HAX54_047724, partial [Datura stramonium]|nr:hypothetical protein [Datura stramonium]